MGAAAALSHVLRHGVQAALVESAGAVADALAALQVLCDGGVVLEALELLVGVEVGVGVVEAHHQAWAGTWQLHVCQLQVSVTK
jgi:hypothetical protein